MSDPQSSTPPIDVSTFDRYAEFTASIALYPGHDDPVKPSMPALIYTGLKLNGESGEVAELIGKAIRDEQGVISAERQAKLLKELGDALWYISETAHAAGSNIGEVARLNMIKLLDRKDRGVLKGSGSER